MNFGQHWRTPGIVEVDYHVELPRAFLRDLLARELPAYVEDCKLHPWTDRFEVALRSAAWPDVAPVLDDSELRVLALRYYASDLLSEWLGGGNVDEHGYVLNTIDDVGFRDDLCWVRGRGRRWQARVKYQDV
jgi:hypothetical protein